MPRSGWCPPCMRSAGAAERERLLDLLEDDRLRQEVALALVARPAVEGAEVAVGDADVRVVEVPVDDERHPRRVVEPVAELVRDATDRDEVAGAEERDRVLVRDPLAVERLRRATVATSVTAGSVERDASRRHLAAARTGARARARARRRRGPSRGTCTARRARAARSCSAASRSSARGTPAG